MIKPHQLERRLKIFQQRQHEFETKCNSSEEKLVRHEVWRHTYANFPYLIGAPRDRLAQRFCDIFLNISEYGDNKKIGIRDFRSDDSFHQKFTHMLEEWNSRGGITSDILASAREPLHRYFEVDSPKAADIFKGFSPPKTPFLVKYGQREFLEKTLNNGVIRIAPASLYSDASLPDSIKDSETRRTFYIPTFRERITGKKTFQFNGVDVEFGDDDIIINIDVDDYYLYSMADAVYFRLPTDFNANAALIIHNKNAFAQKVISAFLALNPGWMPMYGNASYYDPYRDYGNAHVPTQMSKHFRYAYQREVRIAFVSKERVRTALQPQFLRIGPLHEYAELRAV